LAGSSPRRWSNARPGCDLAGGDQALTASAPVEAAAAE
jgi:hypothetical protein